MGKMTLLKRNVVPLLFLAIFNLAFIVPAIDLVYREPAPPGTTDVGIWYSTWYANRAPVKIEWITGFGAGSSGQFVIDVNMDDLSDAVAFTTENGSWMVATSNGSCFHDQGIWGSGIGVNSTSQFLLDVTGDDLPDAISFHGLNGTWLVASNNGTRLENEKTWIDEFGIGSTAQLVGDVDGDGMGDAIAFYNATGAWHVALSNGTSFHNDTAASWVDGTGTGSSTQLVDDVDGDGKDDVVAFFHATGEWHVSLSTGTGFNPSFTWITGHGVGSGSQLLEDCNGAYRVDGKAEAFVFFDADVDGDGARGDWYCAGKGRMNSGLGAGSTKQMLGNVTGDVNGWKASVAFYNSSGTWHVQPYRYVKQNIYNTWDAWNIKYLPLTLGAYRVYDSSEAAVIDEHLAMIAGAQIDFLLLDETNNLYVDEGYIFYRAKVLAQRVAAWNDDPAHRKIRYAIVIGGNQYSHNPATVENEAREVWNQFVNTTEGGPENYYYLDGKPLLVDYCLQTDREAWDSWSGTKHDARRFSLRWAKSPAGPDNYGWEVRSGTVPGEEAMIVMPGWNNNKGATPVSRQHGLYYSAGCWERVLGSPTLPRIVVINSFNEYAEETAIAPADTSRVSGATEPWTGTSGIIDNYMYWAMTRDYMVLLRNGGVTSCQARLVGFGIITPTLLSVVLLVIMKRRLFWV
jgi:hypothetical protein